jgi:hypothetical protein
MRSGFQQDMGSYDGVAWSGETLIAAWLDTRLGSAQVEAGWRFAAGAPRTAYAKL